ncbi:MAG: uL15 family ribosomal protein [Clostridia bacterium]|nr:uL15 family ribosomal protein [Clostridia bacterium]
MNHTTKRRIRTVAWTALLLTLTVLALTCTMTLGIAAADGDTYTLKLAATLYDENGEEWPVGIQTELSEGDTIDTDALFAQLVTHYPHLAGTALSDEGFIGLPDDGKMPAQDLTLSATYEVRPFTVTWIVDGAATEQKVAYGKVPAFSGSTDKAPDAQYTYTFKGWDTEPVKATADATYTATYTETLNKYVITWVVDGVTTTDEVEYGTVPTFSGSTDKAADVQFTYTFNGWDTEPVAVVGDATYTATYTETLNKYTVTWVVDGTSTTTEVEYGKVPSFDGTPAKAPDDQYTYTFSGWTPAVVAVTGDATYTATFTNTPNTVSITFKVDGQADVTLVVKIGETPVYPNGTPVKAADAQYTYTFKGWDKTVAAATEDAIYTAQFDATVRKYMVTFKYGHNIVLPMYVTYGQAATAPTNTDKAPTAQYTYTFEGWDVDFSNITGTLVVTAKYTETVRSYTVTFNYGDGKTETVTVEYGKGATAPTDTDKAATETATYTFKGWDADFSEITSDLTVNAIYDETPVKEPDTETPTEPDTEEPTEPDTETPTEPDTDEPTEAPTDEPEDPTEAPTETETEEPVPGGCGNAWIWIVLVIVIVGAGAAVVIILLRRKNATDPEPTEPEAEAEPEVEAETEPETPAAPLFIPVGEEVPEEEIPEEVETVEEVAATDVDSMMTDKAAAAFLVASDEEGGQGKMGIINVGLISAAYQAGETVDLASLQEKGMIDGNIGRLKVLASGTLDKPLIIKADAFSVQAVKMITLTGGQAIELKSE